MKVMMCGLTPQVVMFGVWWTLRNPITTRRLRTMPATIIPIVPTIEEFLSDSPKVSPIEIYNKIIAVITTRPKAAQIARSGGSLLAIKNIADFLHNGPDLKRRRLLGRK